MIRDITNTSNLTMSKSIKGRRAAHDFKNRGGYSPTCDCGICDCFGDNTAIVYGYKQTVESINYYCDEHIKDEISDAKYVNEKFIRLENIDLMLKNKPQITSIDNIKVDKVEDNCEQCYTYECKNIDNLTNISTFYNRCVCQNCAPIDKNEYFSSGLNRDNKEFTCDNCDDTYKIKYEIDNEGSYCYVGCNNPYKIIGTCDTKYSRISQKFCAEINSKGNVIKPIAIKPKRKNKSKNIEDLTIPENIVTAETFKNINKNN